jgi:hypothetical protein
MSDLSLFYLFYSATVLHVQPSRKPFTLLGPGISCGPDCSNPLRAFNQLFNVQSH